MISQSTTGLEAGEWFDKLPSDEDRQTVTGMVAMAYQYDWNPNYDRWNGVRITKFARYIGVYAIGSRSLAQEDPNSDIDILVAHNLSFGNNPDYKHVDFYDGVDEEDKEAFHNATSRYMDFVYGSLASDSLANDITAAVANAADTYRKPHSFDGQLPDTYNVGGREHKAFVRYQADTPLSALDLVFYKGWHDHLSEFNDLPEFGPACGPKCEAAEYHDGSNPTIFEEVIDTDDNGNQLARIPLYTFGDGEKTIYIPQIDGLVQDEQARIDAEGGWKVKRSWTKSGHLR